MINKFRSLVWLTYHHDFFRYIIVGGSTFLLDIILLIILHQEAGINLAVSTSIAYWFAIAYNFTLNRMWTFSAADKKNLRRHLTPYLLLLGANYLFTLVAVSLLGSIMYFGIAKAIAVIAQIFWTFPIYKRYIFIK